MKNIKIIKYKKRTTKQKELLNLFIDLLDVILTEKTVTLSKDEKGNENENENENKNENENNKTFITTKKLNDDLDKIIDKSKSFKDQVKSIRKVENIIEYWYYDDYDDKELKFKYFKIKLAHSSNEIDEKLFEQIFGHKIETLANKLTNTTNKKENQIIVNNFKKQTLRRRKNELW